MSAERLQKILASAGIASRRDCEELIVAGKIAVNGKVVRVLGSRVDPDIDTITVDGKPLEPVVQRTYVMLHKPTNVISTSEDTHDRPTVVAMIDVPARIFPVGRLDQDSEGLLLLTDDGELTQRLTHPSYEVEKEYHVLLDQTPTSDALREWREGVNIDGKRTAPAWVQTHKQTNEGTWIRMVLQEGRKRQIRMMVRSQDYAVLRLIRIREGPLSLGDLGNGEWRHLTDDEVKALWQHAGQRRFDPIRADEADHKTSYRTSKDFTTQSSRNTTSETSRERTHRQTDERRSKPPTTPPYSRQDDTPKRECNSSERRDRVAPRSSSSKRSSSDRRDRSTRDDQRGDTRKRERPASDRRERSSERRDRAAPRSSSSKHTSTTPRWRDQSAPRDDQHGDARERPASDRRERSSERRDRAAPRSSSNRRDRSTRDDQHGDTRKRERPASDRRDQSATRSSSSKHASTTPRWHNQPSPEGNQREDRKSKRHYEQRQEDDSIRSNPTKKSAKFAQGEPKTRKGPQHQHPSKRRPVGKSLRGPTRRQQKSGHRTDRSEEFRKPDE